MTLPPDAEAPPPADTPPPVPSGASGGPGGVATTAAGCGGVMLFYCVAILVAIGPRNAMIAFPFAALALFGISIARIRGAEGRALVVRVLIGVAIGALIFGGCLALITSGQWRIAG